MVAGDESTLWVLYRLGLDHRRREKGTQGGIEFRAGIDLAVRREIKIRVIGLAGDAGEDQIGAIVHQRPPLPGVGQLLGMRLSDEFLDPLRYLRLAN